MDAKNPYLKQFLEYPIQPKVSIRLCLRVIVRGGGDNKQTDIATYRLKRPSGRFSKNYLISQLLLVLQCSVFIFLILFGLCLHQKNVRKGRREMFNNRGTIVADGKNVSVSRGYVTFKCFPWFPVLH